MGFDVDGSNYNFRRNKQNFMNASTLDEITFNRDLDYSASYDINAINAAKNTWQFNPSYAGVAAQRLKTPATTGTPTSMMDSSLSRHASTPQVAADSAMYRQRIRINHTPYLRAFVTDKVTSSEPGYAPLPEFIKNVRHSLVHNHEQTLLVNMDTKPSILPPPRSSLSFAPLGSFGSTGRPLTGVPMMRPMGSVQPLCGAPGAFATSPPWIDPLVSPPHATLCLSPRAGRHRYFVADVRTHLP